MPDVLDQAEVDALLAAVDQGEIDFSEAAAPASKGEKSAVPVAHDVTLYDFKRPERVSKDQLRSLETMHEVFARNFGASLSSYLRTIVDVKLASVEQLTYSEFIMSLPNPTYFNLVSAEPLEGEMVFEVNPSITFTIIERLLGSSKPNEAAPERPLTDIELILVENVTKRAMEQLRNTWSAVKDIQFKVTQSESNPQLMQIVAPNEPVVLISFEVTLGEVTGMINFCVPFLVIEPLSSEFSAHTWFGYTRAEEGETRKYLLDCLGRAAIEVSAELAETTITLGQLLNLQPGQILVTEKLTKSDIVLKVEGKQKYLAKPGIHRNHKALLISGPAD